MKNLSKTLYQQWKQDTFDMLKNAPQTLWLFAAIIALFFVAGWIANY